MIINRKTQVFLALLVMCAFLFQNCMTVVTRRSQKIPVTGSPPGATIIVDGEVIGNIPLMLKLKENKNHVIRIERQGYNPAVINTTRVASALSGSIILNAIMSIGAGVLGGVVGMELNEEDWPDDADSGLTGFLVGAAAGFVVFLVIDLGSGAIYTLSPKELNVTLTKIEGKQLSNLIFIDAEKFQAVKWIRIKCDDSDGEDEIINLEGVSDFLCKLPFCF